MSSRPVHDSLPTELRRRIEGLQAALTAVLASVRADPTRPQDMARRFGLNKNLTWKVSRILVAPDVPEAIRLLPGPEGVSIFLRAMASAGASAAGCTKVRNELKLLEQTVHAHLSDREDLDIVLDGMRASDTLEMSRRLHHRGASGLIGFKLRLSVSIAAVAPSEVDPDMADVALISANVGEQWMRDMPSTRAFSIQTTTGRTEPLVRNLGETPWILTSLCSVEPGTVVHHRNSAEEWFEVTARPIGRLGESTTVFGTMSRAAASRWSTPADPQLDLLARVLAPAEHKVTLAFVDRSLMAPAPPTAGLYSLVSPARFNNLEERESLRIPIPVAVEELDPAAPIENSLWEDTERAVGLLFESTGWSRDRFRVLRCDLAFPPVPSGICTTLPLHPKPGR